MSCSIDDQSNCSNDNNINSLQNQMLNNQQQQQLSIPNLITNSNNNNITTLTSLGTFTTNQSLSNNNMITNISSNKQGTNNTNGNHNNNNNTPTKIVQAGNQLIITTVFQGGSTQKVVTVAPSSTNNNQNNCNNNNNNSNSLITLSSTSAPLLTAAVNSTSVASSSNNFATASSVGSSSMNNNNTQSSSSSSSSPSSSNTNSVPCDNNQNVTQNSNSAASSSVSASSNSIVFPNQQQQQQQQQQYSTYVETSDQVQNGVSVYDCGNSYYTSYQTNQNYIQQNNLMPQTNSSNQPNTTTTITLSSPPNSRHLNNELQIQQQSQSNQQQQQQQQPIYYMYQDTSMDTENASIEFEGHVAHTAQAAPITVQWLIDNFEPAEGCSLRRSTLYNYYLHHCTEQRLEPVNPASFGKLIRSVFLGLRTRRLGTRGNSKYHYYGIRVKVTSPLNQLAEDHALAIRNHPLSLSPTGSPQHQPPQSPNTSISSISSSSGSAAQQTSNFQHQNGPPTKRIKSVNSFNNYEQQQVVVSTDYKPVINETQPLTAVILTNGNKTIPTTTTIAKTLKQTDNRVQQQQQHQNSNDLNSAITKPTENHNTQNNAQSNFTANNTNSSNLSEEEINRMLLSGNTPQLPNFGFINTEHIQLPANCNLDDVKKFEELYKDHCEKILDMVIALKLSEIENLWLMFWRSPLVNQNCYEDQLAANKFMNLCEVKEVISFVKQCDYQFYQFCIEILIPDVLGTLPPNLVQSIRQLAKHLDGWLRNALTNVPERMKQSKMLIINTFSMTLRRYTSLNHLAQTVRNSLQNENILSQMLHDISKVDFSYIKEQAKWTCDCDEKMINKFEKEFKESLHNYTSTMDNWITWLDTSVAFYLRQFEGCENYSKMAKQFLLKWSFLCSSIIRDLTLRSAASFGSFHLIRLLYDEYMYYIIEHKIANEFRLTPLAVMSCEDLRSFTQTLNSTNN